MSRASETEATATRWWARRQSAGWSEADQAGLDAWLDAAPENRVAFWRAEYAHNRRGRTARRVRQVAALAASLVLVAGLATLTSTVLRGAGPVYRTETGEHHVVPLADGTRVELNTATRLRASVKAERRQVWLERGEAYFDVAHDPAHPFVVHAARHKITVLGTRFSLRLEDGRLEVAVAEGRVRIDTATDPTILTPGGIAVVGPAGVQVDTVPVAEVEDRLGWRQGRLYFDQVRLEDAVAEFNRYNHRKLAVTDAQVAGMRIGGSFEATNTAAFTTLLRQGFGLKIRETEDVTEIYR